MPKYYGKYRGKVVQNVDPDQLGRVMVSAPQVMGTAQNWALPAAPFAGIQAGIYMVPPPAANVWVEFEGGDVNRPIWSGGFWDRGTVPALAVSPPAPVPHVLIQTIGQNTIHVVDGPSPPLAAGGILLKSGASTIAIGPDGVKITAPKVEILGTTIVNNGALTVTL
jgi:Type VI secretion system/phage-baseplate injector OB domain